jgi:hypothetical protein
MMRAFVTAAALFLVLLVAALVGAGRSEVEIEGLRDQRLRDVVLELRTQLQADLDRGAVTPTASPHTQTLLEDGVARHPEVLALEIISEDGLSRFSSDRGLRGQPAPLEWLAALRRSPEGWLAVRHEERSIGLPLHDTQGRTTGYLVLTFRDDDGSTAAASREQVLIGAAALVAFAALLALITGEWRMARRHRLALAATDGNHPLHGAQRRLADVRSALDAAAERARGIAGAGP